MRMSKRFSYDRDGNIVKRGDYYDHFQVYDYLKDSKIWNFLKPIFESFFFNETFSLDDKEEVEL